MSRRYACTGLRRISSDTREGRPLCDCATTGRGTGLYAWIGCSKCRGTGGRYPEGATDVRPRLGPEASASLAGG